MSWAGDGAAPAAPSTTASPTAASPVAAPPPPSAVAPGPAAESPQPPPLAVRDLVAGYPGSPALLEGVSFTVWPGEIFGVLGPSGCGKSTLLRHVVGLEIARAGTVELFGRNLLEAGTAERRRLRRLFGVMYQGGALFGDLTLLENVSLPLTEFTDLPPGAVETAARLKLALVGLAGAEHRRPDSLSGGMRKRAAIARALALEPGLIFLDEPSAGLDPVTSAGLDSLIRTLASNLSVAFVMVTHELRSIMATVDRAILLDDSVRGVVAEGPPAWLADECPAPQAAAFFRRPARIPPAAVPAVDKPADRPAEAAPDEAAASGQTPDQTPGPAPRSGPRLTAGAAGTIRAGTTRTGTTPGPAG